MKSVNVKGLSVESPSKFFASFAKDLKELPENSITIVFIKDSTVVEISTASINHGWLNILEDAIEAGELKEADSAILVQVGKHEDQVLPFSNEMTDLSNGLIGSGIWVMDSFLVEGNHYFSFMCEGKDCCPPEGKIICTQNPKEQLYFKDDSRKAGIEAWTLLLAITEDSTNESDEGDRDSIEKIVELMQDVQSRDYVMANVCLRSDINSELVLSLIKCAKSANFENQPRVAGAAAASVLANECNKDALDELLQLSKDDSLASLVRMAIANKLPAETIRRIFTDSLIQMEKSVA